MVETRVFKKSDTSPQAVELRQFYLDKYADTDVELNIQNLGTESETATGECTTGDIKDNCPKSHLYESKTVTRYPTSGFKTAPIENLKCFECGKIM